MGVALIISMLLVLYLNVRSTVLRERRDYERAEQTQAMALGVAITGFIIAVLAVVQEYTK